MRKKLAALPLAAALLLTGCTAGSPSAAPSTPTDTQAVQAAAPSPTTDLDMWSNQQVTAWMDAGGLEDMARVGKRPDSLVSWGSDEVGTIRVSTMGDDYTKSDLAKVAKLVLDGTDATTVIAETRTGGETATVSK